MYPRPAVNGIQTQLRILPMMSLLGAVGNVGLTYASAVYPTANKIYYIPFRIGATVLVKRLYCVNGAAVSGNIDLGVYDQNGKRLIVAGSTAQASTNVPQAIDTTDTELLPGCYYFGIQCSNTTSAFFRNNSAVSLLQGRGLYMETAGGIGLPSTATGVRITNAYFPACGLMMVTAI